MVINKNPAGYSAMGERVVYNSVFEIVANKRDVFTTPLDIENVQNSHVHKHENSNNNNNENIINNNNNNKQFVSNENLEAKSRDALAIALEKIQELWLAQQKFFELFGAKRDKNATIKPSFMAEVDCFDLNENVVDAFAEGEDEEEESEFDRYSGENFFFLSSFFCCSLQQ